MIRFSRVAYFVLLILTGTLNAQNLYDLEHSKRFASFLFSTGQYSEAAREFERVSFLDSSSMDSWLYLAQSYRMAGQPGMACRRLTDLSRGDLFNLAPALSKEFGLSTLSIGNFSSARAFADSAHNLLRSDKSELYLGSFMLSADWKMARAFADTGFAAGTQSYLDLLRVLESSGSIRHKSPALALGMSVLVPGLGKVYAGSWQDGLISLLFVASNAYQSYRGFNSDGISSVYGWAFGALSLGFYAGNIYGTYQNVKRYNHRSNETLQHSVRHILFDPH